MMIRLAAAALVALAACAKKEEAPTAPAPALAEAAPAPDAAPLEADDALAEETESLVAENCPVLDSRGWKAWTEADGDGHALKIEGEVDLPTLGYALTWREGIADRAMPPGLRVHLDAVPPADLVMQVVTPTPVAFTLKRANANYRVIYVLCGGDTIAEIDGVGPKTE